MDIDTIIESYIEHIGETYKIVGVFICGSYVTGDYNEESDLDTFILVDEHEFEMRLEIYEGILFDRIIVDYSTIFNILESGSPIGNILSYSFGSNNKVVKASEEITNILNKAVTNVKKYNLTYSKDPNKPKKTVDGKVFNIIKSNNGYVLEKDGEILI